MKDNKQNNSLGSFEGWDEPSSQEDFFSELDKQDNKDETATDAASVIEQVSGDDDTEPNEDKPNDDAVKDVDLFKEIEKDPEQSDDVEFIDGQEEEEEEEQVVTKNISTLNFLKEKGLINYELEEDVELTEDLAEQLIEDNYEKSIDNTVDELFEEMPDFVKNLNKFVIKGGDPRVFLQSISQGTSSTITDTLDMEEEANQELVVRETLSAQGDDAETIETHIEFLKDSNKLKSYSEKKYDKWKENYKKTQEQLVRSQAENVKIQKEKVRQAKLKAAEFFEENNEINGLTFSKEDKKELPSYMNDKNIKTQNGTTITQMQKELFYDLPNNEKAFLQLATLMNNRNEDGTFNFDNIANNTKTKVVKEVKDNVRRSKTSIPNKSKTGTKRTKRTLASIFDK